MDIVESILEKTFKNRMTTFKEQYLNGQVEFNSILDFIDAWHKNPEGKKGKDLPEFLGLSSDEMQLLAYGDDQLKTELDRIKAHKMTVSKNLVEVLTKVLKVKRYGEI